MQYVQEDWRLVASIITNDWGLEIRTENGDARTGTGLSTMKTGQRPTVI